MGEGRKERRRGRRMQYSEQVKIVTFGKQDVNRSNGCFQVIGHVLLTSLRGITVVFIM